MSIQYSNLIDKIKNLLENARSNVVKNINRTMVITYWQIGRYIVEYEQGGKKRAEYGSELLKRIAEDLTVSFGKGFSHRNVKLFRQFYNTFPNLPKILQIPVIEKGQSPIAQSGNSKRQSLPAQSEMTKLIEAYSRLSWTHFVRLMNIRNTDERNFYLIETAENNWSIRELDRQINAALFERLAFSKDKKTVKELSRNGQIITSGSDIIKDPYVLEFLNIRQADAYTETELESAIINKMEDFLLELGKGFSFVARQKRISAGFDHFYIDLVFYNRLLKAHILIDLKIGKLRHQDIGQMQMYVNYFDREIKLPDENPTVGIILCKEKNDFVVEYSLPESNQQIFAKNYQLYLPDKEEVRSLLKNIDLG